MIFTAFGWLVVGCAAILAGLGHWGAALATLFVAAILFLMAVLPDGPSGEEI